MSKGKRNQHQPEDLEEEPRQHIGRGEPMESEMVAMFRLMLEEQRKEARRESEVKEEERKREMERMEIDRSKRELALAEKQAEFQKQAEKRQHEQQVELLRLQEKMGETATRVHREGQQLDRKRDRALYSIPALKEGDDVEEFLSNAEKKLTAAGVKKEDWVSIIELKLNGTIASAWQDVLPSVSDYQEARDRLLKTCGYTPRLAADRFFGFRMEQCKGMTGDQLYHRGQQLLRRMVAPGKLSEEMEFSILKGWVGCVVPKRARAALDARVTENTLELVTALQDFLVVEGERSEGQTATFKKGAVEVTRERSYVLNCFKCGRAGHKAADCWKGGAGSPKPGGGSPVGVVPRVITCYTCGEEGHKSPQCPKYVRHDKGQNKDGKPKAVKRVWRSQASCVCMDGVVNGHVTPVLLDSGAAISIVPQSLVEECQLTGGTVAVKPFGASQPMLLPVASLSFEIGGLEWEETVAVPPTQEGVVEEVLYGLDLVSERGLDLVMMANEHKPVEVLRVTTRAQVKTDKKEREEELREQAEDGATAWPIWENGSEVQKVNEVEKVGGVLGRQDENEVVTLGLESDACVADDEEEVFVMSQEVGGTPELEVPSVGAGPGDRAALVSETRSDPGLESWRKLATKKEKGFRWENSLLYKTVTTHVFEVERLLVLPSSFRNRVLRLAHDGQGHMGSRRVIALIKQKFDWPGLGQEAIQYCRSCVSCQKSAKPRARQVPMMERRVLSEPFESLAFDLVGPFPKGKGGCRYLLTCVCMASKWPEALPIRSMTASAVAQGMMEIFSRVGVPLRLLSDQGSQFVGKVVTKLCSNLGIDRIKSVPYHPEGNGVVERMHGTLVAMLNKASNQGLDWVGQVPFAVFALRSAPNRDTGFSPFDLVYGRHVRTPLDILHQGWAQIEFKDLNTDEWADWLVERLECWHSVARERGEGASAKRKIDFDKKALDRKLVQGDLVLCRIPGAAAKLEESWHGPYPVVDVLNRVNYRVNVGKGRSKVLHINNLKKFWEREKPVLRMSVVAEDAAEDSSVGLKLSGCCEDFDKNQIEGLIKEYPEVFCDDPGKTSICELEIVTGDSPPIASMPYRVPDKLKDEVKMEIGNLVEMGVASPSHSPWASPIVPVCKKDGKLRLCVDYRKLNSVTQADPYYMVTLDEILERVGDAGCLSKLDLSKGFYQIGVDKNSVDKTAFISPFGKFAFNRMPFGLKNAPAIFQRCMEEVLRGCSDVAAPYIDDILVFSKDGVEHVSHLRRVVEALSKNGLSLKLAKCEFGRTQLEYLGHLVGKGQVAVPEDRATAMKDFVRPVTKKQLRSFLGMMSYYRRFILNFAKYSSLLSPSTSKFAPSVVDWSSAMLDAFNFFKGALVSVSVLTIPSQEDVFSLHTDASGLGIGATLNVVREGVELPVGFYSRQLQGAEKRYSATELEALAIFKAIFFFEHFLYGRDFEVMTDHKALVSLLRSKRLNKRLHGWILKLLDFSFVIKYKPGRENLDADGLSRQGWSSKDQVDLLEEQPRATASSVGGDVGPRPHDVGPRPHKEEQ